MALGESAAEPFDALIVGAGFNGLYQLYRLREAGFRVRLVDAAADLGGIWHWNCYPGARVDSHVPNYEFSLPELWQDWNWSERYPGWEELRRYFQYVDTKLQLSRDIEFNRRVVDGQFDEQKSAWQVTTTHEVTGQSQPPIWARFLIPCTGFASAPYVPEIDGLQSFAGPHPHTAQWPQTGLDLAGKRVGVIGTGASGVQVIQEAAWVADRLTVFQRTPVVALPMQQEVLDAQMQQQAKQDYPELFRRRATNASSLTDIVPLPLGAVDASAAEREARFEWAWAKGGFHFWTGTYNDILSNADSNRLQYDFWRDKTRARIADPKLAEQLAPSEPLHPFGTKRPALEQNYYEVFNQTNVELVDLRATPIDRVSAHAVHTNRAVFELDVLIFATGFDAGTGGLTRMNLRGTQGMTLEQQFKEGVDTQLGMAVPNFPNLLMLYGPQSPTAFCNGPTCAELQGDWVVDCLRFLRKNGHRRIEASPAATKTWRRRIDTVGRRTLFPEADSWYMGANIPGKHRQLLNYPAVQDYLRRMHASAADGYSGFLLS